MRKITKKLKNKQKVFEGRKGITLIALVITIIVLLILAGVSIATLTGENGILTRANEAKENTEQAEENELRKLTQAEASTYLEEHEYTDVSGKKIIIPAKCAVSLVEGENTLEDGLVIIDPNGNEWVWIEVPESVTASSTTDEEIKNALINYTTEYRNSNYSDTWYEGCGLGEQEYAEKYSEMLQSIKANNGFFIGRYEVGSFDNPVTANDTARKAVIQKGAYPYNYVTCSQAQEISEGLSVGNKTSSLMFGIQWDLVLKYLEVNGDWDTSTHDALYYLKTDSSSWGNYRNAEFSVEEGNKYAIFSDSVLGDWNELSITYTKLSYDSLSGVILSTGATERNSKINIYDFAGSVSEWTLEKNSLIDRPCVRRGGTYINNGFEVQAFYHSIDVPSYSCHDIGFRSTLW